ncbi:hypothetical protein [Helicobacter rodentium]|uniref:hypothetical protein n=1 Tax=Helicobacter rodentium TaxID=59617 RepID=UPI0023557526|nr:hypothetical protein [Helicobacter rodentium]
MRILLGLDEISNDLQNLKRGFDLLGVSSDIILLNDYKFGVDESLIARNWNIALAQYAIKMYSKYKKKSLLKHFFSLFSWSARFVLFVRCLLTYDVFILMAYSRFLGYKELPILKIFNKKVIFQVMGSDFRPPYLNGSFAEANIADIYQLTLETKRRVEMIEKYASYIISYKAASHFQTLPYIDYRYFGLPTDYSYIQMKNIPISYHKKRTVKIVHAPTNQAAKGTSVVVNTIESLKEKYDIEFVLLFNMSNQEVLYHIATCDFAIDQIYSGGGYMAGFSREVAFFKKPVIVTGYDTPYFYDGFEEKEKIPPVVCGLPEELESLIVRLLEDKQYCIAMGEKAYRFVMEEWNPLAIVKKIKKLIDGDVPKKWWCNPLENERLWHYGRSNQAAQEFLREYITEKGKCALLLKHNPKLEKNVLDFCEI